MDREHPELATMLAIGAVTPRSARIWLRSDRPGPHHLVLDAAGAPPLAADVQVPDGPRDRTAAWTYPDELGGAPLVPDTAYRVRVFRGRTQLAEGRLRTPPEPSATGRLTFAAMSCHQPFARDLRVLPGARRMLEAASTAIADRSAAFALAMGDQIYADLPAGHSLFEPAHFARVAPPGRRSIFDCTRAEIRALYHQRYRMSWAIPELQRIYAQLPCWPMLDDHEVADNIGSEPRHEAPAWLRVRAGALDAYYDYQGARVLAAHDGTRPASFDHGFRWGPAAVYQLDVRSDRHAHPDETHVFSAAQLARFEHFLEAQRDAPVMVVMISVPLVFVPRSIADFVARVAGHKLGTDRWSYDRCHHERDRLMRVLHRHAHAHPEQVLLLLSGDIHFGTAFELRWSASGRVVYQLTSSALTYRESWLTRALDELAPAVFRHARFAGIDGAVRLLEPDLGAPSHNPYSGLNLGFVHVDATAGRPRVQLELIGADELGEPRTVYASPWLGSHARFTGRA